MTAKSDLIASLVQQEFDKLPAKRKPVIRDNGLREWVPLSGIVAEEKDGKITCLALATGMKCLPSSKLSQAQGNVLHDWHAEVLAIRAFNCFVLDECRALASGSKSSSGFIRLRSRAETRSCSSRETNRGDDEDMDEDEDEDGGGWHGQPFAWRGDVLLYMYCSEAPCGDASMELTMASQTDATPWALPPPSASALVEADTLPLPGRAYFSQLGIVRRKPSRGDAPPTLSKSCSDKLSLRQCTSLLSSVTSLLVSPDHAYISTLVLPAAQYSASGCRRAFSDGRRTEGDISAPARMAPLNGIQNHGGYAFRPFGIETTDVEFIFSRRSATTPACCPKIKITPSNLSTAYTASNRVETTLNGVLQGRKASAADIRGASFASRRRTWYLAVEVASLLPSSTHQPNIAQIREALGAGDGASIETEKALVEKTTARLTYAHVKNGALLGPRREAKDAARQEALKGWVRNLGDDDFEL